MNKMTQLQAQIAGDAGFDVQNMSFTQARVMISQYYRDNDSPFMDQFDVRVIDAFGLSQTDYSLIPAFTWGVK